ncbi:MAG TPA: PRTRC system protein D [Nitrospira sp.]|jgi:plasmid segregation protein ParM|nr:PRTRC system protein D [Nitrospira sp.]
MSLLNSLIARAIDVGYGHIKFSDGRDPTNSNTIRTDSIPSQSPTAKPSVNLGAGVMKQRDTFLVPVGERLFEVGHDVHLALHGKQETEVMDENFCLGDAYAARLFGAINYMVPNLPADVIDVLVLGLPLNTYRKHHAALAKRFVGEHVIDERGGKVQIKTCHVYPQPLGSYMSYLAANPSPEKAPLALSIDPGYNTVDWFVCQGMSANDSLSDAVPRGMGAVLRAIADDIIKTYEFDATPVELVRAIDRSLTTKTPFELYGQHFDLEKHLSAGDDVVHEAAQAIKNSVGSGSDIRVIILTGGGASFYAKAVADKFPRHKVVTLEEPALANVRGFHLIGEKLAKSLGQALKMSATAAA